MMIFNRHSGSTASLANRDSEQLRTWMAQVEVFMKNTTHLFACVSFLVLPSAQGATPSLAEQASVWVPHDVMVVYRDLPKPYSCDALWYKVRDILRAAGAWKAVSITPYDCKPDTNGDGRSPQLEVRFLTLRTVSPENVRWAQTQAVSETVVLKPGNPQSLARGDCKLLKQTNENLLSLIPNLHVVDQQLQCPADSTAHPYHLSLQTLVAVASPPASAAK